MDKTNEIDMELELLNKMVSEVHESGFSFELDEKIKVLKANIIEKQKEEIELMKEEVKKVKENQELKYEKQIEELKQKRLKATNMDEYVDVDKQIEELNNKYSGFNEKIDNIYSKHINRMVDKYAGYGISSKELGIDNKEKIKEDRLNDKGIIKKLLLLIKSKIHKYDVKKVFKEKGNELGNIVKDFREDKLANFVDAVMDVEYEKNVTPNKTKNKANRQETKINQKNNNKNTNNVIKKVESKAFKKEEYQERLDELVNLALESNRITEDKVDEFKLHQLIKMKDEYIGKSKEKIENEIKKIRQNTIDAKIRDNMKKASKNELKEDEKNEVVEEVNPIEARCDVLTGKYILKSKNGTIIEKDFNKELLTSKARNSFAVKLVQDYPREFQGSINNIEDAKTVSKYIDLNLYNLYYEYDKQNESNLAKRYVDGIRFLDEDMPTEVVYDFKTLGRKENKLPFFTRHKIKNIARDHKEMGVAKIEENPKTSLWKKIAIGLGIAGGVAVLGAGSADRINNDKNVKEVIDAKDIGINNSPVYKEATANLKFDEKTDKPIINAEDIGIGNKTENANGKQDFKDNLKVDISEKIAIKQMQKEDKELREKLEKQIGIGSTATLEEGTYYYSAEGNGPTGKMENRDIKEVTINLMAVLDENNILKECYTQGDIEKVLANNPNAKIRVHISNEKGDLGWIPFEQVKDKFIDKMIKESNESER